LIASVYTAFRDKASASQSIMLAEKLGEGGEGSVWSIVGRSEVAKIYTTRAATPEREQKLSRMLANPPQDDMFTRLGHVSIAWPTALLYQDAGFSGFLMPRLSDSFKILDIYNPKVRRSKCPGFNWKYLVHTALNLSIAVNALHARNYIIGDINEGNILVNRQALVSLIDTDSFQVEDNGGQVYRCPVGKEEFTPPELHGIQFNQVNRLPQHDYFGLAVLIFLLLMEGNHPFSGVMKTDNPSPDPDNIYCLKSGKFPYNKNPVCAPRPTAPRFEILPPEIRRLMLRSFVEGYTRPSVRPSPAEWVPVLEKAEASLVHCRQDASHWYARHLRQCPWCSVSQPRLQVPLPPLQTAIPTRAAAVQTTPAAGQVPSNFPTRRSRPASSVTLSPSISGLTAKPSGSKSQPQAASRSVAGASRDRFIRWLGPSNYRPKMTLRFWWKNIQTSLLIGLGSGLALAGLVWLVFNNPLPTSYILSSIASLSITALGVWLTFFRFNLPVMMRPALSWPLRGLMLILFIALAVLAWPSIDTLAVTFLSYHFPQVGWLVLDGLTLGAGLGAAYGTFRLFARYKNLVLAFVLTLVLAASPFLILFSVGAFVFSFK
jgi:serine/threonine protein kinase